MERVQKTPIFGPCLLLSRLSTTTIKIYSTIITDCLQQHPPYCFGGHGLSSTFLKVVSRAITRRRFTSQFTDGGTKDETEDTSSPPDDRATRSVLGKSGTVGGLYNGYTYRTVIHSTPRVPYSERCRLFHRQTVIGPHQKL